MNIINLCGFYPDTVFNQANTIYVISGNVTIQGPLPAQIATNCILRFTGEGHIDGTVPFELVGNNTRIEAGLFQIFGEDTSIGGTWIVTTGYPEWWGAKASIEKGIEQQTVGGENTQAVTSGVIDCSGAIQKAFDSPIGHITFSTGYYYLAAPITLRRPKEVTLQGHGQWRALSDNMAEAHTILWTNKSIDVLILDPVDYSKEKGCITIDGGTIDVSSAIIKDTSVTHRTYYEAYYTRNAILIYPNGTIGTKITMSLLGPLNLVDSSFHEKDEQGHDTNVTFNPVKHFQDPNDGISDAQGNFVTEPYSITDPITNVTTSGHFAGNGVHISCKAGCSRFYNAKLNLTIRGFGTGIRVDYQEVKQSLETTGGDVTSLKISGLIFWCIRSIYASSRAFNGGEIMCDINAQRINYPNFTGQDYVIPLVEGDMQEAYLDPFIWDIQYGCPMFKFTNTDHMRFGPRLISLLDRSYSAMGQKSLLDDSAVEFESLTQLATIRGSAVDYTLGILDPLQLGAFNAKVQASDYVHLIDNDLLSIDKVLPDAEVRVDGLDFNNNNFTVKNPSPFDPCGMIVNFSNTNDDDNAKLTVTARLAQGNDAIGKLQFMAIHLKGYGFIHFGKVKVTLVERIKVVEVDEHNQQIIHWELAPVNLYEGDYYNAAKPEKLRDIIIPILITGYDQDTGYDANLNSIIVELSGLKATGLSVNWSGEAFKMFIEGRLCKHANQLVWTAGGGEIGGDIKRHGKPYLLGTKPYTTLLSLPADAAIGARGVAGSGDNLYPVIKTASGWFVENLVGTDDQLTTCKNTLGRLNVGQQAYNTESNKPVWWNGSAWVTFCDCSNCRNCSNCGNGD